MLTEVPACRAGSHRPMTYDCPRSTMLFQDAERVSGIHHPVCRRRPV